MKKFLSIVFLGLIITSNSMSYEEANYEVVKKNEVYEIRKYSDRLAIETDISNEGNSFRKLFNYISGNNDKNEEIKMTTPVTQMQKKGNMTMQFYLPSRFNKENIPSPSNPDVKILNIKGGYYAVIRYSGRASDKNFIKHKSILENELKKDNMIILSPPIKATYDGPFTLPMNRRNEAMFEINIKNKGEI
ncbi:heme-binding protein [Candidatus Pelagibacter ubique]|jgi:effector-binding domain-containing protein|uniref:SOUL family heme-binding protein n=1 Tax=Pelagibacter ubique TaxID=198252 RepID=UPI000380DC2E|nr:MULTISPECIES: heme-binding protein [Pelagibacter]MDA7442957.1 heme-binding protein [Candidatus Pelagibacter ubique]MDA7443801.1 heme-binding protein [Candidatus Pelagibacter ubique]MDA7444377.1 heme-binding protein [Candidatus Pelagibacter ubique]MDA7450536.1 heme-binding protein [Candidatus Pelagibacter ubique]MDA8836915.1 heme-binding protein [Candidatus Pelagibacter bacterium]